MSRLSPGEYSAVLNDVRLHYTIRGRGPALIAHSGGPGMDPRGWDDFAGIDEFATVIALHPRGCGLSDAPPDDDYLLSDYAADVEALRLHLELTRPIVTGWSHGGMVAQQFAFTYPDSLSKLILYDTAAYFGEFLSDIEAAVRAFADQPWYGESFAALQKEWAGNYETDEDLAALLAHEIKFYFREFGPRAEAYCERTKDLPVRVRPLRAFNDREAPVMDLRPRLGDIRVPALILVGRHDFITNVAMAEEMARHIPDARLVVLEESGHFGHVEEPERFREAVGAFVQE
jgi:proline iminopeptidase